jgi:hypothetical protein
MSSSRPFSQIRSSEKSLLMAAVVVVFNWEGKPRTPEANVGADVHQAPYSDMVAFAAHDPQGCPPGRRQGG